MGFVHIGCAKHVAMSAPSSVAVHAVSCVCIEWAKCEVEVRVLLIEMSRVGGDDTSVLIWVAAELCKCLVGCCASGASPVSTGAAAASVSASGGPHARWARNMVNDT